MEREWRCSHCSRLLGMIEGDRLHIKFARGHEYLVGLPTTGVCRNCRTLNELRLPCHIGSDLAKTAKS